MKVREIIPGLLYTRGRTRSLPYDDKAEVIKSRNIKTVVCLVSKTDRDLVAMHPKTVEYIIWPMSDGKRIETEKIEWIVDRILERLGRGEAVLVHCNAGRNRTGLIVTIVLSRYYGISQRDALKQLRQLRPGAVANLAFERYLLQ